jgi:hypothetical protein
MVMDQPIRFERLSPPGGGRARLLDALQRRRGEPALHWRLGLPLAAALVYGMVLMPAAKPGPSLQLSSLATTPPPVVVDEGAATPLLEESGLRIYLVATIATAESAPGVQPDAVK